MDLILEYQDFFFPTIKEFEQNDETDALDAKFLNDAQKRLEEMSLSAWENLTPFTRKKLYGNAVQDDKDTFLIPAPKLRLKNKKKNSKGDLCSKSSMDLPNPPLRVTRSSQRRTKNKSSILNEGRSLEPRRTRSKAEIFTVNSSFDVDDDEIPRPKRITRSRKRDMCSENVDDIVRPKRVNRSQAKGNSMTSSSDLELDDIVRPKRATRCKMESASMNSSVNLDIGEIEREKNITKASNVSDLVDDISSVHASIKKSTRLNRKKHKDLVKDISIVESNNIADEFQGKDTMKTSPIHNETNKDNELMKEVEVDDEWMSEEEEKEKSAMQYNPLFSSTPKKLQVGHKVTDEAIGAYKSLRNKRVKKASTDILGYKSKPSSNKANILPPLTITQESKTNGIQEKEDELKKMKEKETEALKRKEALMKKRAEKTKRKREEKMAKVKKTREEVEIECKKSKKLKKERPLVAKKTEVADVELKSILSPIVKVGTPKLNVNVSFDMGANVTFEVKGTEKENDVYNMTPCWQDVSPGQPDNPNDYGMVDKSDCSSDEENDPRKKIPAWAQILPNNPKLLTQSAMPQEFVNAYWDIHPRQPTIKQFFGSKVSQTTKRRGLTYRTSSAIWNTPPVTSLKN